MQKQYKPHNQKGQSILTIVIAVATVVPIILVTFSSEITALFRSNHAQRVYSLMSVLETKIRAIAAEPIAYSGCGASTTTCTINWAAWTPYFPAAGASHIMTIAGAQCSTPPCGVNFAPTLLITAGLAQLSVTLTYNGQELGPTVTPTRTFQVQIPYEILHGSTVTNCNLANPFFEGLDSMGNPVCNPVPTSCGPGKFLTSINPNNMSITCSSLPSATLSCPATQFISKVTWAGATAAPTILCTTRKDPFLLGWPLW